MRPVHQERSFPPTTPFKEKKKTTAILLLPGVAWNNIGIIHLISELLKKSRDSQQQCSLYIVAGFTREKHFPIISVAFMETDAIYPSLSPCSLLCIQGI